MTQSEPGAGPALPAPPAWVPGGPPAPPLTQPPVPVDQPSRTSPLTVALELIGLVSLGSVMALATLAGGGAEVIQGWLGVGFILARLVGWWFRTYTVTAGELVLDEGVLQKHHRVVPFSRIQQVELRQRLMARALGITTVHIETAADAGGTAVTLRSLDLHAAEALRDHLLAEQRRVRAGGLASAHGTTAGGQLFPTRTPLVRLSPGQLLAAGATSTGVVATAAVVLVIASGGAAHVASTQDGGALSAAALFVVFGAGGIAVVTVVSALGTLLHAWGFELSATADDLHLAHGLLDRRQHTMPRHRLQHARVVDNPVRRALGTASVQLHSAATPGRGDEQQGFIDIPLVRWAQVGDLLATAMGSDFRPPKLGPRPPAARRRAVLRRTALTSVLAIAVAAIWWPAGAGVLPLGLLGLPWGLAAHRRAGSALDGPVLAVASGVVIHHLELVPAARLQSARTSANPLQRRVGLATLHLDVAGASGPFRVGSPGLRDLSPTVAASALPGAARSG